MSALRAPAFPEDLVRMRARAGAAGAFPPQEDYGTTVFGARPAGAACDAIDALRLVPPVFMPRRLEKLFELAREPGDADVELKTRVGGFSAALPVFVAAFGSTDVASADLGIAAARQAGRIGIPLVIGENVVPVNGYGRASGGAASTLLSRIAAYLEDADDRTGGVVVQQSTEDADAEVWNHLYSDPATEPLVASGRLAFELKVGQGAKPGLGGMTIVDGASASRLRGQYAFHDLGGARGALRCSAPGTFTAEILRQQVRLMRNNFPRCPVWVKLHPARDVREAAMVAWDAGADAVTVDGAEGGTGWAPTAFLDHVGLPLGECLARIGRPPSSLLATGRIWEGARAVKCLALGATAVGLGRAALIAVDEDPDCGLVRLVECLALELRQLVSALGKYAPADVGIEDVWPAPASCGSPVEPSTSAAGTVPAPDTVTPGR